MGALSLLTATWRDGNALISRSPLQGGSGPEQGSEGSAVKKGRVRACWGALGGGMACCCRGGMHASSKKQKEEAGRLTGVLKSEASPADAAKASHKVGMGRVVRLTAAP